MAGKRSNTRARLLPTNEHPSKALGKYEYEPLRDKNKFRILDLHPGFRGDEIKCSLKTFHFNDCPLYTAISHRWDTTAKDGDIMNSILIDDKQLRVQPNIYQLLLRLREHHDHRRLWIDSICINQSDDSEKQISIPMMREIYSQASYSIAWLADAALESQFNLLHAARCYVRAKRRRGDLCSNCDKRPGPETVEAFYDLFEHEYWNRRWIIQEVVLANTVEVQCGHEITPLSNLVEFVQDVWKGQASYPWDLHFSSRSKLEKLQHSLPLRLHNDRLRLSDSPSSLRDLLHRYQSSECSERNDKIFALLSLSRTAVDKLEVDYRMSSAELLFNVVHFCYTHENLLAEEVLQLGCLLARELDVDLGLYSTQANEFGETIDPFKGIVIKAFHFGSVTSGIPVSEESTISDLRSTARALIQYSPLLFLRRKDSVMRTNGNLTFRPPATQIEVPMDLVAGRDLWAFTCWSSSDDVKTVGLASVKVQPDDFLWYFKGSNIALIVRNRDKLRAAHELGYLIVGRAYLAWVPEGINTEDAREKRRYDGLETISFDLSLDLFVKMTKWTSFYGEDRRAPTRWRLEEQK